MPDERAGQTRLNPAAEGAARHGIAAPRGQHLPPGARGGRFGRMFPSLAPCDPTDRAIDALADVTAKLRSGTNPGIPAGYTYLGQFVDHDITFDPTSQLQRDNDPGALVNFRTPRLDLDSLYGSGPADQPFLYDWDDSPDPGVRLLVDHSPRGRRAAIDLPRNRQGRALVGDGRNDENLILAQLHLLFIRFHNRVVDCLSACPTPLTGSELFDEAQRIVRWHYQWIVAHDFLKRIVGPAMAQSVLRDRGRGGPPTVQRRFYRWRGEPAIPVEFSGAAYRFGHSMVRQSYRLNGETVAEVFPIPNQKGPTLTGFRRLPRTHTITWERFFFDRFDADKSLSMSIDARLSEPLSHLPHAVTEHGPKLAQLNLLRGRALGLPSGQDVARAMSVEVLAEDDLLAQDLTPHPVSADEREALLRSTPLWYYILCEAQKAGEQWGGKDGGQHLGPVGGRIVAELLVGLLEADPHSYLRQWPTWTPTLQRASRDDFTMVDLVAFTQDESEPRCP